MAFFTNITRKSGSILSEQVQNIDSRLDILHEMKELALHARLCLQEDALDEFGASADQLRELARYIVARDH